MTNEIFDLLIAALIGVALIVFGNYKRRQRTQLIAAGIRTEGTVLRMEASFSDQTATYHPVVSYSTLQNETITKTYSIGVSYKSYKPGDSVNIIYDVNDNKKFIINNTSTRLLGPAFIIVGCVIIIFTIVQYFLHPFALH